MYSTTSTYIELYSTTSTYIELYSTTCTYIVQSSRCELSIVSIFQATDESEASEEEIEQQLRKTDRVWVEIDLADISVN